MVDFVGSTSAPNEVDNPANYRLVMPGNDGIFQTTTCSLQGDDNALSVTIQATGELNTFSIVSDTTPLSEGNYRLFACSTLTDIYSNALDGNNDSVAGDDYSIAFSTTYPALNLFVTSDADTYDGICDADCTLRDAVGHANGSPLLGTFTIDVPSGFYATGGLNVGADMVITGSSISDTIIDGQYLSTIFESNGNINLTLRDMTLQNARSSAISITNDAATLALERVAIQNNEGTRGGALYLSGVDTTISNSLFMNNIATGTTSNSGGGAIYFIDTSLEMRNSAIINNQAIRGSAIHVENSRVGYSESYHIVNTTITGNTGGSVIFFTSGIRFDFVTIAGNGNGFEYRSVTGTLPVNLIFIGSIVADNGSANCTASVSTGISADGTMTIGLYNQSIWRLRNSNTAGGSDIGFNFGIQGTDWQPLASYRGGEEALAMMAQSIVDTPLILITPTEVASTVLSD